MLAWRYVCVSFAAIAVAGAAAGACTKTPTYVDDTHGAGGSTASTASGSSCMRPSDCAGSDNECSQRTCTMGECGVDMRPKGFVVAAQSNGDCKKAQCDGSGKVEEVADDTDVPDDGNTCTSDVCKAGVPSHPAVSQGTPCGATGMLQCDGAGKCTGCMAGADCGASTACITYSCVMSNCDIQYTPADMGDPGNQTGGDCHRFVCNGMGGIKSIVDDTDVPNDGNACTDDTCTMGAPSHANSPQGAPCGAHTCDGNGACTGCSVDTDCGITTACATYKCSMGKCSNNFAAAGTGDPALDKPGDCQKIVCDGSGSTKSVADDTDKPSNSNPCLTVGCMNGAPTQSYVAQGTACGNLHCDGMGSCVGCLTNSDCPAGNACTNYNCNQGNCIQSNVPFGSGNPPADAPGNCQRATCDGAGHAITVADDSDKPNDGNQCTGDDCAMGNQVFPPLNPGTPCNQGGGSYCNGGGSCVQCVTDNQCSGGGGCSVAACKNNSCTVVGLAQGTVSPNQTPGNCHTEVCDGNGGTQVGPVDDMDVPNDNNVCTTDSCMNGNPVNTPINIPNDGNPCTDDICDPVNGIQYPNSPAGASCPCLGSCDGFGTCNDGCDPTCQFCNGQFCKFNGNLCQ